MKEGGHVSLYIDHFRSLVSRIGDWGERALINHFRKGFGSRIPAQLASHPSSIDSLQELMDFTLELDTRYHKRQKEKNNSQEKKTEASNSSSSHYKSPSSSSHKKKNFRVRKRYKPHSSLLNRDHKLMGSEKERRINDKLWAYCGWKHSLEACIISPQNQLSQPEKSLRKDNVVFNGFNYFSPRAQLCIINTGVKNSIKFFCSFFSL
ncbi:hypothetical protein O181_022304 [Austropuccinia psidii MF-1]|uniref:Retrotransposon gag domain-containing protein n=1 Tax=Austropuccinia psidii MF-1 TaxID=1389203 RepID=A0A9Q3GXJ1_9BASI|nr:hypothetical protein [Austropuccinia psidii MF-1]